MSYEGNERRQHPPICLKEHEWGELQQILKNNSECLYRIEGKVCKHIDEGERPGGVRDRLLIIESEVQKQKEEISVIKSGYWKTGLSAGFIGALIGNIAPEAIKLFVQWITGI